MMLEHQAKETASAPRVHGWFQVVQYAGVHESVCPACAWVVPTPISDPLINIRLPRVCMGGSEPELSPRDTPSSAPRVHGWFPILLPELSRKMR